MQKATKSQKTQRKSHHQRHHQEDRSNTSSAQSKKSQRKSHSQGHHNEDTSNNNSSSYSNDVTEVNNIRNVRRESSHEVIEPAKERRYSVTPVKGSASGKRVSKGGWRDDSYEVHLGAYGDSEESSLHSPTPRGSIPQDGSFSNSDSRTYARNNSSGKAARLGMTRSKHNRGGAYSSDSDYSTTLEIKQKDEQNGQSVRHDDHGNIIRHYNGDDPQSQHGLRHSQPRQKPRPPTLTKGNVTRFKHEYQQQDISPSRTNTDEQSLYSVRDHRKPHHPSQPITTEQTVYAVGDSRNHQSQPITTEQPLYSVGGQRTHQSQPFTNEQSLYSVGGQRSYQSQPFTNEQSLYSVGGQISYLSQPLTTEQPLYSAGDHGSHQSQPVTTEQSLYSVGGQRSYQSQPITTEQSLYSAGGYRNQQSHPITTQQSLYSEGHYRSQQPHNQIRQASIHSPCSIPQLYHCDSNEMQQPKSQQDSIFIYPDRPVDQATRRVSPIVSPNSIASSYVNLGSPITSPIVLSKTALSSPEIVTEEILQIVPTRQTNRSEPIHTHVTSSPLEYKGLNTNSGVLVPIQDSSQYVIPPTTIQSQTILNPYIIKQLTPALVVADNFPIGHMQEVPRGAQKVDFLIDASQMRDPEQLELIQRREHNHKTNPKDLPIIHEMDENKYAAFSNEPIIVAGVDKNAVKTDAEEQHVIENQGGRVYGTQPAVTMSTRQQLNFFLFNQVKNESPPLKFSEQPLAILDAPVSSSAKEVEFQPMDIFNKGTQTLTSSPQQTKKIIKETTQMIQQHQVRPPSPVEEQITDTTFNQAFSVPTCTYPPSEEESEEEIIETIVIEEREQRIAMSIAEEIEFTSNRTQGGRTIDTTNEKGEIKPFWIPEKWEAVVDRRKQKMIRVKDTEKDEGDSKQGVGPIAHTVGDREPLPLPPPKITTETSTSNSSSMLEKELEKQIHSPSFSEPNTKRNQLPDRSRSREIPVTKRSNSYEYKIPTSTDFSLKTSRSPSPPRRRALGTTQREMPSNNTENMKPFGKAERPGKIYTTQQNFYASPPKQPPPPPPLRTLIRESNTIALPNVHAQNNISPNIDDDKLPESLDHFDRMIAEMERELPMPMYPLQPEDHVKSSTMKNYQSTPSSAIANMESNTEPDHQGMYKQSSWKVKEHVEPTLSSEGVGIPYKLKKLPAKNGGGKTIFSSLPAERIHSKLEPENFSFGKRLYTNGEETMGESNELLFDPAEEYLTPLELRSQMSAKPLSVQAADGLDGAIVHTRQSEPQIETKIMKDADGNLVKVTELRHSLSKIVESQPPQNSQTSSPSYSENRNHSGQGFLKLVETRTEVVDADDTEDAQMTPVVDLQKPIIPEVTEDTVVRMVPVEFDIQQKSLKVNDDDGTLGNETFLYNMNTNELQQAAANGAMRQKYLAGDTMRTSF